MTKDKALQQALDALTDFDYDKRMKTIEIIKEALETKEWVGLTEEEIETIYMDTMNFQEMGRALEAKLKERNT
jgi:hypothetical protein